MSQFRPRRFPSRPHILSRRNNLYCLREKTKAHNHLNTLGPRFVKRSVYFSQMAHGVSKRPAIIGLIHANVGVLYNQFADSTNLRRNSSELIAITATPRMVRRAR
jgi:hypothetical protein